MWKESCAAFCCEASKLMTFVKKMIEMKIFRVKNVCTMIYHLPAGWYVQTVLSRETRVVSPLNFVNNSCYCMLKPDNLFITSSMSLISFFCLLKVEISKLVSHFAIIVLALTDHAYFACCFPNRCPRCS